MAPEGKNQRGWNKLESKLQIAVRFFQPFLLAPGNEAAKKQRSFTELLNATVRPTEELFWPLSESLARVPMWLLGGNVDQYKLQSSKAPVCLGAPVINMGLRKEETYLDATVRQSVDFPVFPSPVQLIPTTLLVTHALVRNGPLAPAKTAAYVLYLVGRISLKRLEISNTLN
jgi:hypothetical protein